MISKISAAGGGRFEYLRQEVLAVVAEDEGDAGDGGDLLGGHLGEAAHDDDPGLGVEAVGLADGGAALLLGHGGDGAGVDDVEVGRPAPVDDRVAVGGEAAQDVGGLGVVEFAAKGMGGDGHVRFEVWRL